MQKDAMHIIAFLNLCRHVHQSLAKELFFISRTHNKTKRTIKENQYEMWCSHDVFT